MGNFKNAGQAGCQEAERVIRTLKEVYNTKRVHSALGYKTPAEYETLMRVPSENGTLVVP